MNTNLLLAIIWTCAGLFGLWRKSKGVRPSWDEIILADFTVAAFALVAYLFPLSPK